jgi:hypothetical protein
MRIAKIVLRLRAAGLGLAAVLVLGTGMAQAQEIVNRSFEQEGRFSLMGWQVTDASCQEAYDHAPPEGGAWSLKLHRRNLQGGCFGVAYQVIPPVRHGEILRVTAWARVPAENSGVARVYWTTFAPSDTSGFLPYVPAPYGDVAASTSDQWTMLTLSEALDVAEGDSVGIVLDAGVTSGPTGIDDGVYFDLVSVERFPDPNVAADAEEQPEVPALVLAHNFPNPFRTATTISFSLSRSASVTLDVYDLLGRKVETLMAGRLAPGTHAAVWEAHDQPDGLYIGRLQADAQVRTIKLVRMR